MNKIPKEKIIAEREARAKNIDPSNKAYYGNGWQARGQGGKRYLNQFQRSKKEPEPMGKYIRRFDKKLIQDIKNHEQLHSQYVVAKNARNAIEVRYWNFFYNGCSNYYGANKTMNIPVVYEDETEGEFDLEFCCASCAQSSYGWSVNQFSKIFDMAKRGDPIKIPNNVTNEIKFKEFVRSL